MSKEGGAYEHDVGAAAGRSEGGATPDGMHATGIPNENDMPGRNRVKTDHGPETNQDTKTVRGNPRMHDLKLPEGPEE